MSNRIDNSILFISYYYPPNTNVGAKRIENLVKYMVQYDYYILTTKNEYKNEKDNRIYHVRPIPNFPVNNRSNIIKKIINRLWVYISPIDDYFGFVLPAIIKGFFILKKNNIIKIVVTGPPFSTFIIGFILSEIFNKKLILDYRDPWINSFQNKEKLFKGKFNYFVQKKILEGADAIIFNTKDALNFYIDSEYKLIVHGKSYVINNGFEKILNNNHVNKDSDRIIIIYSGNFYGERRLFYLFEPLIQLVNKKIINLLKIQIHVYGKITQIDKIKIKKYNLVNNIIEMDYIPYDKILSAMSNGDILYLVQGNDFKYSIPYKFFDYLSIKKPILAVTTKNSAIENIMKEIHCGEICYLDDNESIIQGLINLIHYKKKYLFNNIEKFEWKNLSKEFSKIIESV